MGIGNRRRPLIGLLYSAAAPIVIEAAGSLVESLDVIPERLFHDLGLRRRPRFHPVDGALAALRRHAADRHTSGHGIALSLASDRPLDEALLDAVDDLAGALGFAWYSEHLTSLATTRGTEPYDEELLTMLAAKVARVQDRLGMRLLLENPAHVAPVHGGDYTEPELLNELARRTGCGVLLDLHNLHDNERNHHDDCDDYLTRLDLENVVEVHVAGGAGLFAPQRVWELLTEHLPRMTSLSSVIVEIDDVSLDRASAAGIVADLERMHEITGNVPAAVAA